jgi:uncharacterized RDD family membrane protein YckC
MSQGSLPPPIPPEEREPARLWEAEFDPAPVQPGDFYRPLPTVAPGGYAPWGLRVLGALLDGIVAAVPLAIGQVVVILSGGDFLTGRVAGVSGIALAAYWLGALATVGVWLWNTVWRQGRTGQSLGKSWLSLRLVDSATHAAIGPGMSFIRQLAHIVDALPCYLGFLWPLWDAQRQTFADKIVGTLVIRG